MSFRILFETKSLHLKTRPYSLTLSIRLARRPPRCLERLPAPDIFLCRGFYISGRNPEEVRPGRRWICWENNNLLHKGVHKRDHSTQGLPVDCRERIACGGGRRRLSGGDRRIHPQNVRAWDRRPYADCPRLLQFARLAAGAETSEHPAPTRYARCASTKFHTSSLRQREN